MPSIAKQYAHILKEHFGDYRPIWLPNVAVTPGDILRLSDSGAFERVGSLKTWDATKNLNFSVVAGSANVPIDFVSSSGVSVTAKLSGSTNAVNLPNVPQANAGISIEMKNQGDFIMYADTASESYIDDLINLEEPLHALLDQGKWENDFVIAARVVKAPFFTTIISYTTNAKLELSLEGTLSPSIRELGKVGVNATTLSSTGNYFKMFGATNVTPLVIGVRLVPEVFHKNRVFHIV